MTVPSSSEIGMAILSSPVDSGRSSKDRSIVEDINVESPPTKRLKAGVIGKKKN
jgi:hypothetical protein